MTDNFEVRITDQENSKEYNLVLDALRGYNSSHLQRDRKDLTITIFDSSKKLAGGLNGATYWGWLFVEHLWVREDCRRSGLGKRLIALAETEAKKRGCRHAYLDTFSFQAPEFYKKLGYTEYAKFDDFPAEHSRYFFKKDLVPSAKTNELLGVDNLMASKSHLEFAIYSAKMGIWDIDLSTQSVFCSQEMLDLWGVSADEYKNKREILQSKVHPDDLKKMRDAIDHAIQTGQIYQLEYRIRPTPEQEKWVLSQGRCIYDQSSERPSRFSGVVFDITDRKLAELKRQASEQMLVAALSERDRSLEALSIINEVGRSISAELELEKLVQWVTDAATKVSGAQFGAFFYNTVNPEGQTYSLYTISGASKKAFSHLPLPRVTEIFRPTFFGEETVRSDDITKDARFGKSAPYHGMPPGHLPVRSYLAVSVVSRSGEVLGGLFLGHEKTGVFTERSQQIVEGLASQTAVALDNARLYRKLQEAVHARDEFLSIASHELKTPLTTLQFQAQMRARSLSKGNIRAYSEERLKKMADTDSKQVEYLSRLVDDMLDISRINTGKFTIQPEAFDLCELAQDVLERHLSQFEEANTPVHLVSSGSVEGIWDKYRIEQVISNLLTNAIRYGRSKPVEITVKRENDVAMLTVQDQGIGIAKEHQTRIFERYERAVSANEISGLGLGLYIVKQILEMHRGTIKVESDLGAGSTFIVELPLS